MYAFGPVRVDVARHIVSRDGRSISLAPKTYELLLILLRSGGRVLSRQELLHAQWPDTFVEEANLSFQISTVRKAFGEDAGQWIETVPKVGYRFTADVRVEPGVPSLPALVQSDLAAARTPSHAARRWWILAIGVVAAWPCCHAGVDRRDASS